MSLGFNGCPGSGYMMDRVVVLVIVLVTVVSVDPRKE